MSEKVNLQFRILYAFGILFVVIGHAGSRTLNFMTDWFPYSLFHLGLFAFASGYFFNSEKAKNTPISYFIHKFKSLMIPLYLWNFIYGAITFFLSKFGFTFVGQISFSTLFLFPILNGHQFGLNLGSWFITPLFMCHMYAILLRRIFRKVENNFIFAILGIIIGIVGIKLAQHEFRIDWFLVLTRFMYFVPFYEVGILYRSNLEKKDTLRNWKYFSLIFSGQLIIIFLLKKVPVCTPSWCTFPYPASATLIGGFLAISFWLRISRILVPVIGDSAAVALIGGNTFSIMMHHLFGSLCLNTIFAVLHKFFGLCNSFNWQQYKQNVFYVFLPHKLGQMSILYIVVGIGVSLCINNVSKYIIAKAKMIISKDQPNQ